MSTLKDLRLALKKESENVISLLNKAKKELEIIPEIKTIGIPSRREKQKILRLNMHATSTLNEHLSEFLRGTDILKKIL